MTNRVQAFIKKNNLFVKDNNLLLAVSGGLDSVVLTHIIHELGYTFSMAHCNFKLRANESDEDELFVKNLSKKLGTQLFTKEFDTKEYAKKNKLSIEESARTLRYSWFEELKIRHNFDFIVTGHHLNDRIETFFINLTKGTGIKGLRSIQAKNENVVRPLLSITQDDLIKYAENHGLEFRIDQTNFDHNFLRNKFRHQIIPLFEEVNPNFSNTMAGNLDLYEEFEAIYHQYCKNAIEDIVKINNKLLYIDLEKLSTYTAKISILFEILHPYGFNSKQIRQLKSMLSHLQSGKEFLSNTHTLLVDRNNLILREQKDENRIEYKIEGDQAIVHYPTRLSFEITEFNKNFSSDKNIASLDADKVKFPLTIRNWNEGDYFHPLGMKGKKKLSDFFTDLKFNQFEKENTFLLVSDDKIIWIIGQRIDDRFKITDKTQKILQIKRF